MADAKTGLDFAGFMLRLGLVVILVFATYNPTSYSYINWVREAISGESLAAVHFLLGMVLLIGWVILVRATLNSMGRLGLILGAIFLVTLVWFLVDIGLLYGTGVTFFTWIVLVGLSILLTMGLTWSHIWRRLTGQYSVEDIDD